MARPNTAPRGLAALLGGIAVAVLAPVAAVQADQIDGEWCAADGRIMSIEGPRMVTPGGNRIRGNYTRHTFSYTVPEDEPGPGTLTTMRQLNDLTIHVLPNGATEARVWRRCAAPAV